MRISLLYIFSKSLIAIVLVSWSLLAAATSLLDDRMAFWHAQAFKCQVPMSLITFPSRPSTDTSQPCDDGDITLFNGLLCAAGAFEGCKAVADAQDPKTGQWYRSPRIRTYGNDRGGADFSPDMALGVELYLIKTGDSERAWKWLMWMNDRVPCIFENPFGDGCWVQGIPRFCVQKGCDIRHGDAASLALTVSYLQSNHGMGDLPNGRLRGHLGSFSGYGPAIEELDAQINKPGYSQHLVGVAILLMRNTGLRDGRIDAAANTLSRRNPHNAFFTLLDRGITDGQAMSQTLAACPAPDRLPIPPLHQWQWEREESDRAWRHSCYWDCIFMGNLLRANSTAREMKNALNVSR
jgi:hypothetical protein